MKIKQIKQVLISSVYALLMLVVFLLVPSAMKAQTEYKDNQDIVFGTSDSRMVITINDKGDHVELRLTMLGKVAVNTLSYAFVYNPDALGLTSYDSGTESITGTIYPPTNYPNPVDLPLNTPPNLTESVVNLQQGMKDKGFAPNANFHYFVHPSGGVASGMAILRTEIPPSPNQSLNLDAGKTDWVYSVYFKKKPGHEGPVTADNFGFCTEDFPWVSSSWIHGTMRIGYIPAGAGIPTMALPGLFTYRSAALSTADSVSNATTTTVDLYGTFNINPIAAPAQMYESGYDSGSSLKDNLLKNDNIQNHGFFYSLSNVKLETDDFSKELILTETVDGNVEVRKCAFPALTSEGFTCGGSSAILYMVEKNTTLAGEFVDFLPVSGLLANTDYYGWSYMRYTFETSETYAAVGEKLVFQAGDCGVIDLPETLSEQTICAPTPKISDLYVNVEAGNSVKWYDGDINTPSATQLSLDANLSNGSTYYVSNLRPDNCESARVPVTVTFSDGLSTPVAETPQRFCPDAKVFELEAEGAGIEWYASADGGTPIPETDLLADGLY